MTASPLKPRPSDVSVDLVRAYWNRRPCNIRHSPREVGSREYFEDVEERKYTVEPHIKRLAEFERWKGKKVLEIGCGIGTDTISFARAGARVTAVDLSEASLDVARRRAEVFGLADRIRFYQSDAENLSQTVPVERYDLIYSFGVIHHTPHPNRVLDQLRKYAGPTTILKVMVYHHWSWKVLWILFAHAKGRFWRLREFVARHSEAETGCPVTYTYTRSEGRQWLASHGFDVQDSWVDHIFPYRIPEYIQYRYKKVWYFRYAPRFVFRACERVWGWHLCMTARHQADT